MQNPHQVDVDDFLDGFQRRVGYGTSATGYSGIVVKLVDCAKLAENGIGVGIDRSAVGHVQNLTVQLHALCVQHLLGFIEADRVNVRNCQTSAGACQCEGQLPTDTTAGTGDDASLACICLDHLTYPECLELDWRLEWLEKLQGRVDHLAPFEQGNICRVVRRHLPRIIISLFRH